MASNVHNANRQSNNYGQQQRQRATSVGKIRQPQHQNAEDPTAVARQILDLRERRESGGAGVGALGELRTNPSMYSSKSSSSRGGSTRSKPTSHQGRVITTSTSNMSEEEIQAEHRLKRAESKISGLLDELEELKFFQELEHAPTTPRTPKTPSRGGGGGGSASFQSKPRGVAPQPQTPSQRNQGNIPVSIRAISPARGEKLPPPPPVQKGPTSASKGGLETYRPMSPRKISKLDRNSLELECQTLVRKIQLLEQERNSQSAMIEMYEISMQEHDTDKAKIQKLESELMKVSSELKRQLHNIQKGKEALVKDYEEKLQANLKKLHRVQEIADSYKMDAEASKSDAERWKQDLEMNRSRAKEEKTRADDATSREAVLELQLKEARNLNATLVKKIEKKRSEVSFLKEDLTQTNKILAESKENRDEAYEARIAGLQQQLTDAEGRYTKLEEESSKQKATIQEKDLALESARVKDTEQSESIRDFEERVVELERQAVAKFEEGKKAGKSVENKKMAELIGERAKESREYERRLKAMQEQLKHQSDRHHAEIQDTQKRNDARLAEMREEVKEEIRIQEGDKATKLESELSSLRRNFEEAKIDHQARLKEAQSKSREAAIDFKQQDEVRQQELDQIHERLDKYVKDNAEKESKLKEWTEAGTKLTEEMETLRAKHQAEILERDQKTEEERRKFADKEADLQDRITAMKATHVEIDKRLRGEVEDLRTQVDEAHKKLIEAQSAAKDNEVIKKNLVEVEVALTRTREELDAERHRHENFESELRVEVAKLEGNLRASESNLKSSKSRIIELETQLDAATTTSSKFGEEKQAEIKSLRARLDESQAMLDSERKIVQENEGAFTELNLEISSLQQQMKMQSMLEDQMQDLKRQNASLEYEKKQKESELDHATKSYEETRAKMLDAEQRYMNSKAESESNATKRERLVERYEKNIQDLEFRLENERNAKMAIESSISEVRRKMDSLETDKIRKEKELSNLRKDYEDLSALLEENLHSSAKKDEIDLQLKRREREMKETVDIYNQQISDIEEKLSSESSSKSELQFQVKDLQKKLESTEREKARLLSQIADLKRDLEELEESKREQEESQGGVQAELGRKDRQIREAVQRYTRKIADLESKLEEETQDKLELEDKLSSARSELEDKQKNTEELVQKQTKSVVKLESDLRNATYEKEQLRMELDLAMKDLDQKRRELTQTVSKYSNEVSELRSVKQEHTEYKEMSATTRSEVERMEKQMSDMKKKIPELLAELDAKSRECEEHKSASRRYEIELSKRKEQLNEAVARYTDKIARLESELDEHSVARSSTQDRVETVKAEASRKDLKLKELHQKVAELESKLEKSSKFSDAAKQKVDGITRELEDKEADFRNMEMEKIELETKLDTQTRTQKEMRAKVSDLSSRLERKEREVREVTDRYKMYVMELESKLDQDTDAKHVMQTEIDKLKVSLNTAAGVSNEAAGMREQINALEDSVDEFRIKLRESESKAKSSSKSLEERLSTASKEKEEVETLLNKANSEKAEVIAALEGVINEVQNREDEIESLSELLHRRDEELEHAKIIATKALQSAKDIQKRYRDKEQDRESEAFGTIDELHDNINELTAKNDTLGHKISSLERDLKNKNLECKRLKDQLKHFDENQLRDHNLPDANEDGPAFSARHGVKDDSSAFSASSSGYRRHYANSGQPPSSEGPGFRVETDQPAPHDELGFGGDSFSPSPSPRASPHSQFEDERFEKEAFDPFDKHEPEGDVLSGGDLSDGGGSSTIATTETSKSWRDENESVSSETRTRKSIERDALRRYVRQRYRKRG